MSAVTLPWKDSLQGDVGRLALDGAQEPERLVTTTANELGGSFSPDGRFFAFSSDEMSLQTGRGS
jgi:hypothetical protein